MMKRAGSEVKVSDPWDAIPQNSHREEETQKPSVQLYLYGGVSYQDVPAWDGDRIVRFSQGVSDGYHACR